MATILIVDDSDEIREYVSLVLEQHGFKCVTAETGEQALAIVAQEPCQLILCDLVMPLTNGNGTDDPSTADTAFAGLYCIQELKKRNPDTPVIAISGELVGAPLSVIEQFGANGTLSKPFDEEELLRAVTSAIAYH